MGFLTRHPLPAAICAVAFTLTAGVFVFARPEYRPAHQSATIKVPDKRPAHDAAGRTGWVWPDGVPGWEPGYSIKGYPISGLQAIEAQPAQLAAAHAGLDANNIKVLVASHTLPGAGPVAIFAAPMLYTTPQPTCLAAVLPHAASVTWLCPGATKPGPDIARSHVLVAATAANWSTPTEPGRVSLDLVGVARGDVYRVVLHIPGQARPKTMPDWPLYERGKTWGQFEAALAVPAVAGVPELEIYGRHGLLQTLIVDLKPGDERVLQ